MSDNDWTAQNEGPYEVTPMGSVSPEDWARAIVKRPGMYLGSDSFEPTVGFIHGVEHQLLAMCQTQGDFSALPANVHNALLRRDDNLGERHATCRLEPLLLELFTAIQTSRH